MTTGPITFAKPMRINGIKHRGVGLWILELREGEECKREDGSKFPREVKPEHMWFIPVFEETEARDFGYRLGEWL